MDKENKGRKKGKRKKRKQINEGKTENMWEGVRFILRLAFIDFCTIGLIFSIQHTCMNSHITQTWIVFIFLNLLFKTTNAQYNNNNVYFLQHSDMFRCIYVTFREPFLTYAKVTKSKWWIRLKCLHRWLLQITNRL